MLQRFWLAQARKRRSINILDEIDDFTVEFFVTIGPLIEIFKGRRFEDNLSASFQLAQLYRDLIFALLNICFSG